MCTKLKYLEKITVPGEMMNVLIKDDRIVTAHWGYQLKEGTTQHKAQIEGLSQKDRLRSGIIELDGFFENGSFFYMPNDQPTKVAVILKETATQIEFVIVTRASKLPVTKVHKRQPLLIGDNKQWLEKGIIVSPSQNLERELII